MGKFGRAASRVADAGRAGEMDRRGFLVSAGVLAAGAVISPWLVRPTPARAGERAQVEAGRRALGTWMRVVVRGADSASAQRGIEAAFAAVARVDAQMSVHRADSELTRVNRAAGREPVAVSEALRQVVALACASARRTGGLYDPTVLPLMRLYGFYGAARERGPSAREVDRTLALVDAQAVRVDDANGTLGLALPGAGLDLGSIGKGWAIDRAVDALRAHGVTSALVDLGGNVYGLGTPDVGAPGWSVGVFHPATGALDRVFVLRDRSVATSGNAEQTHMLGALRVGHLFDARRGKPSNGHLSSSVVAATGVESDVLSTISYLLGPDRFRGWPGALQSHFIG
jgi:thiamine biosynthesis lipoprotein